MSGIVDNADDVADETCGGDMGEIEEDAAVSVMLEGAGKEEDTIAGFVTTDVAIGSTYKGANSGAK